MHGGQLVVVKRAAAGSGAARLRHEAACLRRSAHPGVVELVAAEDLGDGGAVVRTAFVGGGTLAERPHDGFGPAQIWRIAASVAATMADLHQQGTTHGRVSADHVLVRVDGGAMLCGFAEAEFEATPEARRGAAAVDVAAVGALIQELVGGGRAPGAQALVAVADRARAEDPEARPSMRSLAEILQGLGRGGGPGLATAPVQQGRPLLPRTGEARCSTRRTALARPRRAALGLVGSAVAVMAVVVGLGARDDPPPPSPPLPLAPAATPAPSPALAPTEPGPLGAGDDENRAGDEIERVWPPPTCRPRPPEGFTAAPRGLPATAPPGTEVLADIDGDGCAEVIEVDGGVVRAGARRWKVAATRDVVLVGDWNCDAVATPAVLRPGSGEVWRYPRWADEGEEVVPDLVMTVPGAVDATVEQAGEPEAGCHRLSVLDTAGGLTAVDASSG